MLLSQAASHSRQRTVHKKTLVIMAEFSHDIIVVGYFKSAAYLAPPSCVKMAPFGTLSLPTFPKNNAVNGIGCLLCLESIK